MSHRTLRIEVFWPHLLAKTQILFHCFAKAASSGQSSRRGAGQDHCLAILTNNLQESLPFRSLLSSGFGFCPLPFLEGVLPSHQRVSRFPERVVKLWGSFWGGMGSFWRSPRNFRGTSGLLLTTTVREVPEKFLGSVLGNFWQVQGAAGRLTPPPSETQRVSPRCLDTLTSTFQGPLPFLFLLSSGS